MQPLSLCIILCRWFEETYEKTHLRQVFLGHTWKRTLEKSQTDREFEDTYEKTQQEPFLIDMFYLCNKSNNNKNTFHEKNVSAGKSLRECYKICFYFEFCVLALGTSWTTYQCQLLKLKFIMYGGNLTLTHSHLYHYWHFPTMVGFCHGGNMPASHHHHHHHHVLTVRYKSL